MVSTPLLKSGEVTLAGLARPRTGESVNTCGWTFTSKGFMQIPATDVNPNSTNPHTTTRRPWEHSP
jgi:hypothetical protein